MTVMDVFGTFIMVIPTEGLQHPKYFMKRMKFPKGGSLPSSSDEKPEQSIDENIPLWSNAHRKDVPAAANITSKRSRRRPGKQQPGIIKQFVSWIFSDNEEEQPKSKTRRQHHKPNQGRNNERRGPRRSNTQTQTSTSSNNRRSRGPRRMRPHHSKDRQQSSKSLPNQNDQQHKSVDPLDD